MSVAPNQTGPTDGARPASTAVCETVHTVALALWLGALITGGLSAAIVFPSIHALDPRLPGLASYGGEHWRLLAGRVQSTIFIWADFLQLGAAMVAFFSLGLRLIGAGVARAGRRAATVVRTVSLAAAVVLLACSLMFLAPRMNPHLKAYWSLASEGRTEEALAEAEAFASYHATATRLHAGLTASVLVALVAGVWSLARRTTP